MASPRGPRVLRLLLGFLVAAAAADPGAAPPPGQVCGEGCCAGPAPEGSAVAAFCGNRTGATLRGRCCVDGAPEQEAVVVGLDLGNCSLTTLCSSFQEARTAVIIDLTVWLCPEASLCTPDGPGLSQCLCMSPYHGYKCLRQGSFPYLLFLGTLGAVTATLSILLWVTQRRKAKTS